MSLHINNLPGANRANDGVKLFFLPFQLVDTFFCLVDILLRMDHPIGWEDYLEELEKPINIYIHNYRLWDQNTASSSI